MAHPPPASPPSPASWRVRAKSSLLVFRQVPGTFGILWEASRGGVVAIALVTLGLALLPAAIAWTGKLIVDAVVAASRDGGAPDRVLLYVGLELVLMAAQTILGRLRLLLKEIVGAQLARVLAGKILAKALTLDVSHFEDSEIHDRMQRARREASDRPLTLVLEALGVVQSAITLAAYSALLLSLSWWLLLVLALAAIPTFVSELRFAGESFRLNSWRAPEGRQLNYLEYVLTRDSHVKEVKLFELGELFLGRFSRLYAKFFAEDTRLAVRRAAWGTGLGLVALLAFYGCYVEVATLAAAGRITLGDMTLYLVVFRQGQAAFSGILSSIGAMYEGALFMSNLFDFLRIEPARRSDDRAPIPPGDHHAIELRGVSFRYPGKAAFALEDVSLTIAPREKLGLVGENGAGKSTLVKLLLRLYEPSAGTITYGGVELSRFDPIEWRRHIGAVFQDAVHYQLSARENIGVGDAPRIEDLSAIRRAAEQGGADQVVAELEQGYETVLGGWFQKGQELSGGQWQKIAVARGFMRSARLLVLDEPAASIDAEAEAALFERLRRLAEDRIALVISHRFSTMRIADRVAVLHHGRLVELGTHDELMAKDGRYAHLFRLQAAGYR